MRHLSIPALVGAALLAGAPLGFAQDASVKILSPADGAVVEANAKNELVYEIVPGPRGNHSHLYVDGTEEAMLRKFSGSYALAPLSPGVHNLCVKVVTRFHFSTGVEQCVKVTAR